MTNKHAYSRNCGCPVCDREWARRSAPIPTPPATKPTPADALRARAVRYAQPRGGLYEGLSGLEIAHGLANAWESGYAAGKREGQRKQYRNTTEGRQSE